MLELVNLHKRYGRVVALEGCTFQARRGRALGFLGRNGAGKTTCMRSIFGLVRLDQGEVRWDGRPITEHDRRRFGYMPEERGLYPQMAVRSQLAYFGRLHGMEAVDARTAADSWLDRLNLTDRAGAKVDELSHGNQQRVQLAVALVHGADVLVLDEPFAGLDPIGVEMLSEVIRGEADRGVAVVFSSHQLDLVESVCDDVAIIDQGRVLLTGSLRDVREASRLRYVQVMVQLNDGPVDWSSWVTDSKVVWQRDGEVRLTVPQDVDPAEVLARAAQAGQVRSFRFEAPSLEELFVEAVQQ
jgi:ABC-2 type transport system ATP-binding protein